jgi:hypothetical protein
MKLFSKLAGGVVLAIAASSAAAAPVYVGSWDLYSGADWWTAAAPILSGQEAAASLFGGVASDYLISTNGADAADINYSAWYDVFSGSLRIDLQDYRVDSGDLGVYDAIGDTSAMVQDHASGLSLINYAFRRTTGVPEPLPLALMSLGLAGMALVRRRRKQK